MYSDQLASAPNWCNEEFANIDLKDTRLNNRCQTLAIAFNAQPNVPINQACEDWADTKAAYRFFDNDKVTHEVSHPILTQWACYHINSEQLPE